MRKISDVDFFNLFGSAERRVRVIGVVPFDLNWEAILESWVPKFTHGLQVAVLCESDNLLFARSFTSDTDYARRRRSFRELQFIRNRALELPSLLGEKRVAIDSNALRVDVMHLPIPISVIQVDENILISPSLDDMDAPVEDVGLNHQWRAAIDRYLESYFDNKQGLRYAAGPDEELLELFDHERLPRGIFPRKSFYDTDYSQLVVWALIFDRKGRLLIHRRSDNAKDNQGMWDKSVGGHVDFSLDVDTSRAVLREMIEELFVDERVEGFKPFSVTDKDTIFLGEWRPEQRGRNPFREISTYKSEWAYFRLRNSEQVYTPRRLPDGSSRRLRVIADVFVVTAGPILTDELLTTLKNSEYKLVELSYLKNVMDRSLRREPATDFDKSKEIPEFTPDLTNIMTGGLRDTLEEFAQYVKRYLAE